MFLNKFKELIISKPFMKEKFLYLIVVSFFMSHNSFAQDQTRIELNKLKERIEVLEQQIQQQDSQDFTISLKPSPTFKSKDGKMSFSLDGRIMIDAGFVTKEKTSSIKNDITTRRAWIGTSGNIDEDWSYRLLVGFENNDTTLTDAFIKYGGLDNVDILIGHFFENNGVSVATMNLISSFMERSSAITAFRPLRRNGVSVNPYGKNWGAHFGVFGSGTNNSASKNDKGIGVSSRIHYAAINDQENHHFLHLGFNNSYRSPDSAANEMRFNTSGNSKVINATLIDSGIIAGVDDYYQNMAEFRYQKGSFTLTSEYLKTNIRRNGYQNLEFDGAYVTASYFLTGEKFNYNAKMGAPTPAKINKNAWEIAARYSLTDLNDKDIAGGKLRSYDFGVNYHVSQNLRFMANYIINRMDQYTALQKRNPQYLLLRAQINF